MRGNSADAAVGDAQNPYRHGEEYIEPGGDAEKAAGGPGPAQSQLGPDVLHTQHKVDAHRHQQRTEGGDVDGDEIHPASHARQGFQEQAGEEGGRAHQEGGNGAGQAEGGGEGLAAGLQHVHQGGDARKEHGDEEEQGEDAPAGHLLEDLGEGDEHELRPAGGVDAEGKHRGQDGEARQQGGQGVQYGGHARVAEDVLALFHIAAVDEHARAVDGQGEEGLSHGHHPGLRVEQIAPVGPEQVEVALHGAGQEGHPDGDDEEQDEEGGHHDLAELLNAGGHAEDQDGGRHRHRREVPGDGAEVHRQGGEEALSVPGQDGAGEGACGVPQHPAHHHRVADGDAQHPQQGDGAQHPAAPAAPLPEHVVQRAHGAGAGEAAQGELPRQAHIAEQGDEQEIGDQEGAAAVLPHPVGKEPDVGHAHRGAHRGQHKADGAGKLAVGTGFMHDIPPH